MIKDKLEKILNSAFNTGASTAHGYISGLGKMKSKNTLGEADNEAWKIREAWPENRDKLIAELMDISNKEVKELRELKTWVDKYCVFCQCQCLNAYKDSRDGLSACPCYRCNQTTNIEEK